MSRKVWFAYMTTSTDKGAPGIYYDDLPNHKANSLHNAFLAPPVDISHLATGPDGEVLMSFAELRALYPEPPVIRAPKLPLDTVTQAIVEDAIQTPEDGDTQDRLLSSVGH